MTSTMLLGTQVSFAADSKANTGTDSVAASPKKTIDSKSKAQTDDKQININAASREELTSLPGIGDAEADKIMAGRPYGSKGWLVSKHVLPTDKALAIKDLVYAGKPSKDAAKKPAGNAKKP